MASDFYNLCRIKDEENLEYINRKLAFMGKFSFLVRTLFPSLFVIKVYRRLDSLHSRELLMGCYTTFENAYKVMKRNSIPHPTRKYQIVILDSSKICDSILFLLDDEDLIFPTFINK